MKIKHSIEAKYLRYDPVSLKHPPLQLGGHFQHTYLDNVAIAQIVHLFQPRNFLDFGCFLGGLPMMVEDLLELAGSDMQNKTQWYLFDNFSFLKEIVAIDQNYEEWSKTKEAFLSKNTWKQHAGHLRSTESKGLLKSFPIPADPQALEDFLKTLASKCNAPYSNIKLIADDIIAIDGIKFDIILFDLSADQYLQNRQILEYLLQNNLTDGGILAMDDVECVHPEQLLLFLDAVTELDLSLIATAGNKVFLQKTSYHASKQDRNKWIEQIYNQRAHNENNGTDFFFYCYKDTGKHGHMLKMLPNRTQMSR
jgi:hypothetical protein